MDVGQYQGFHVELHDPGIALATFDQPERMNGMYGGMKRDLVEMLLQAQMDDAVRVVVFTGTGRAFCAGDDMTGGYTAVPARTRRRSRRTRRGHRQPIGTYDALRAISQAVNRAVRDLDKLTVAAINGYAIQTGFSLALACDFRLASTEAQAGIGDAALRPAARRGRPVAAGPAPRRGPHDGLPHAQAHRVGWEALELGLVHEVCAPDELLERSLSLARELAEGPQVAMRMLKRSIYNAAELSFAQACDEIASKTAVTDWHPDAKEGEVAFREKRTPTFNAWLDKG